MSAVASFGNTGTASMGKLVIKCVANNACDFVKATVYATMNTIFPSLFSQVL